MLERVGLEGLYKVRCIRPDGGLRWQDEAPNVVVKVGKNLLFDAGLEGNFYKVTGPYMGLVSTVDYTQISADDTMSDHPGWAEAGLGHPPIYTGPRPTVAWQPAVGGHKDAVDVEFKMLSNGPVRGAFLVYGDAALPGIDTTVGVLFSVGPYLNGDQFVQI